MAAKLKQLRAELLEPPPPARPRAGRWLASVVTGHQPYYAVPGNYDAADAFRSQAIRLWRFALSRRSQKGYITWDPDEPAGQPPHTWDQDHAPMAQRAVRRQISMTGAQCGNSARRDLRGGPPAMAVPTATWTNYRKSGRFPTKIRYTSVRRHFQAGTTGLTSALPARWDRLAHLTRLVRAGASDASDPSCGPGWSAPPRRAESFAIAAVSRGLGPVRRLRSAHLAACGAAAARVACLAWEVRDGRETRTRSDDP